MLLLSDGKFSVYAAAKMLFSFRKLFVRPRPERKHTHTHTHTHILSKHPRTIRALAHTHAPQRATRAFVSYTAIKSCHNTTITPRMHHEMLAGNGA